jgi:threonine 3-dehydrogenase
VPGCFAEYFVLPEENVVRLPADIPDEVAAILDPLGNAVHTALSFELAGEDVLITGAGPLGILAAAVCHHAGARYVVITDHNDYRLKLAQKMGATATVCVPKESITDAMNRLGMENGFEVGLEMSGSFQAFNDLLQHMQPGARIGLLGILPPGGTIDWDLVIFKMLTIKGIYGREIFRTWDKMLHLLQSGLDVRPVITHRFPAEQFQKAFEVMMSGQAAKVLLEW